MTQTHSPQTFNHPALELPFLEAKFSEFNERFFSNVIPVDHVVIKVVPKLPQGMIGAFVWKCFSTKWCTAGHIMSQQHCYRLTKGLITASLSI